MAGHCKAAPHGRKQNPGAMTARVRARRVAPVMHHSRSAPGGYQRALSLRTASPVPIPTESCARVLLPAQRLRRRVEVLMLCAHFRTKTTKGAKNTKKNARNPFLSFFVVLVFFV